MEEIFKICPNCGSWNNGISTECCNCGATLELSCMQEQTEEV